MTTPLQTHFDAIHADDTLKQNTKDYIARQRRQPAPRRTHRALAIALCTLLLFIGGGGFAFSRPIHAISVDINPSLELGINCFNRVVSVEGFNEDGVALADTLDLKYKTYDDAIDTLMASDTVNQCLAEDELVSITVAAANDNASEEMLATVSGCHGMNRSNISCHAHRDLDPQTAHAAGLSLGKYQAYLSLQEVDPSITPEDVQAMSMRDIENHHNACCNRSNAANNHSEPTTHHGCRQRHCGN